MTDIRISQVAKAPHFLNLPPELPSGAELNESDQLFQLVARARSMRQRADANSRKSLHHELTMCYHAALFIITHEGAWENLFKGKNHDVVKPRSDFKVLQAVLLEYTGDDLDGRKKASRYKRALQDLFEKKTPPLEVFEKLTNDGGVDGLLQSRLEYWEQVPRRTTLKSITVTQTGLRNFRLPAYARQSVVFATDDVGASFHLRITKTIPPATRALARRIKSRPSKRKA